ncbi:MAG: CPBP family intramembrane glutamic endopeptidase [bacterium]
MRNGYFGIGRAIGLVVGIGVLFNMISGLILVAIYGVDLANSSPTVLILSNSISQLVGLIGIPVLLSRSFGQEFFQTFRLEGMSESRISFHLVGIPIIAFGQLFGSALSSLWISLLSQFPDMYSVLDAYQLKIDDMMKGLTTAHSPTQAILFLFGIAVIPAFAEEFFFRGFVQTNIERSGKLKARPIVAIIVTSILFAALHLSPFNFPGLCTLGLLLGWLAYRTCDLRVSILAHAFNNGIIVLVVYFASQNTGVASSLAGSTQMPVDQAFELLTISALGLASFLYLFQRITKDVKSRTFIVRQFEELNEIV